MVSRSINGNYVVLLYEKTILLCKVTYPTLEEGDDHCMPGYKLASQIPVASIIEADGFVQQPPSGISKIGARSRRSELIL